MEIDVEMQSRLCRVLGTVDGVTPRIAQFGDLVSPNEPATARKAVNCLAATEVEVLVPKKMPEAAAVEVVIDVGKGLIKSRLPVEEMG